MTDGPKWSDSTDSLPSKEDILKMLEQSRVGRDPQQILISYQEWSLFSQDCYDAEVSSDIDHYWDWRRKIGVFKP